MKNKIEDRKDLKKVVERLKKEGKRVVFTNGCFDLIHVGHTRYLEEAKKLGDILIVAVNSDQSVMTIKGNKRPIIPEEERAEVLSALQCVDFVVIFHEPDPLNIISLLKPDVLVKGGDWSEDAIIGREVVESIGGKVVRIPEIKGASSSSIIDKIVNRES
ncbi:MAG: D-glycero-beta-D-manno-heptose 1-phosphate adenylyltransferase [Deltaproteobacteria bacterium CG_4_8_14_3_um_filter_43_13]|nr:MAG: glycerol-3-phosphate cytidylyltransferase [Deltaproteobacteria bacterium CG2_30_43_15]PIX24500.1 MAG: D-glycero-beta-D-manno-heptose 1-phosphate adenylyltransferase [Deltaproteobacteria bacterium CG_4_8_14_3_um_filter_43_13]